MKLVILAAGQGVRMRPLTLKTPKPLLKVGGRTLIHHVLVSFPAPSDIDEIIIVVDYLGDQIKKFLGKSVRGRNIRYVQGSDKGNVYSFFATRKYLKNERFLLMYGDEIPNAVNVEKCLEEDLSILTFDKGVYDGVMVLNTDIFSYEPTDEMFKTLVKKFVNNHEVSFIEAENFVGGINTPDDILRVEKELYDYFFL